MTPGQQSDLTRALARVRTLPRDLELPRDLAHALAHELDRTFARDRTRIHHLAHELDVARNLARDLDVALDLARAFGLDPGLTCARNLDRHLTVMLNVARDLARNIHHRGRARNLARDIPGYLYRPRNRVLDLRHALEQAEPSTGERSVPPGTRSRARARRVSPPARRLAAVAAWLLPAGERARYGAEYRSELHDLAASGAGRRQQLAYAVRLLVRAAPLRVAVLVPRRGKASP